MNWFLERKWKSTPLFDFISTLNLNMIAATKQVKDVCKIKKTSAIYSHEYRSCLQVVVDESNLEKINALLSSYNCSAHKVFDGLDFHKKFMADSNNSYIYYSLIKAHLNMNNGFQSNKQELNLLFFSADSTEIFYVNFLLGECVNFTFCELCGFDRVKVYSKKSIHYIFDESHMKIDSQGETVDKVEVYNEYDHFPFYQLGFQDGYCYNIDDKLCIFHHRTGLNHKDSSFENSLTGARYDNLDDEYFFDNVRKYLQLKAIPSVEDINEDNFWRLVNMLWLDLYVSKHSDIKRILKFKIIVANRLIGNDRFDESKFNLKSIHFNVIKKDYFYFKNLSLNQLLKFKFITLQERKYIESICSGDDITKQQVEYNYQLIEATTKMLKRIFNNKLLRYVEGKRRSREKKTIVNYFRYNRDIFLILRKDLISNSNSGDRVCLQLTKAVVDECQNDMNKNKIEFNFNSSNDFNDADLLIETNVYEGFGTIYTTKHLIFK